MKYRSISFLWGSARFSGTYFQAQSVVRERIEMVKSDLDLNHSIFRVKTEQGNDSWRLKIPLDHPYVLWMLEQGYVGRNEEQRSMPLLSPEEEAEFLRGYFSAHHTLDTLKGRLRLRFYASGSIMERLTEHLHAHCGAGIKKPQNHRSSDICKILYYQSPSEVEVVYDYLFGGKSND